MTRVEYLVLGQGISGTFLSWYLEKANRSHLVIDNNDPSSSSRVASGVINPVTGRRIVKTWMIGELLPFAEEAYNSIGNELGITAMQKTKVVNLFPSPQMRVAFADRVNEDVEYLRLAADENRYSEFLNYQFGFGEIVPVLVVQMHELLSSWRKRLSEHKLLLEAEFDLQDLKISAGQVQYRDIVADKIIFCNGISAAGNPYFKNLPFAANKGEALVIHAPELPADAVFKKAISLVPLGSSYFWAGASYEWEFENAEANPVFFEKTRKLLVNWLKVPFTVEQHVSSIRPATLERRPFIGLHPHIPEIGIMNGMGTKGCSLAPFFADQFVNHLTKNTAILPQASVGRFTRILQTSP